MWFFRATILRYTEYEGQYSFPKSHGSASVSILYIYVNSDTAFHRKKASAFETRFDVHHVVISLQAAISRISGEVI